ncbi:MAG: hypothetical protein PHO76_11600 [Methylotenera sp.]|nr:hypothetical protein [Methylotenera sp.]MDD4925193.1 hypothetical protein [Methylotenera sp.]NOU39665.1 hypothetical protein [Methylotenera sp.]
MNKLQAIFRRFWLGGKFKHQYSCHKDFGMVRHADACTILWKKQAVAEIALAHTLSNKFSGVCFTIATGPSLADVDLKRAASFETISLNCAIKKFTEAKLKPTHCIIVDHRVFENQWSCVKDSILSGANCFFSYVGLSRICEREPELLKFNNIYLIESISRKFGIPRASQIECQSSFFNDPEIFVDDKLPELCRSVGFSSNLKKGLFSGKTVATWAVQLGVALGYRQNFILGMDLGGTGKSHFYTETSNKPPDFMRDYEPYIRICFEQAKRASVATGFDVYNLSKDSTLPHEIIPKISFEEALRIAQNNH